ncbi:MAG: esterase family protein [Planctomycetes bacterium]|nr:esterase family protein [Planctomycetota bacterium]
MTAQFGNWTSEIVAGHRCDLFEPDRPSEHGFTVLYLHGLQAGRLGYHEPIVEQFERHGLRVISPKAEHSWWADRICTRFDPDISAERYLLEHVLPFVESHWDCKPPQLALMGASMGGQGVLRLAYKHPNLFPVLAAIFPSIDFQIRIEEGDPVLSQMYRDAEDARQDTATLHIHPLNWPRHQWFCCDPVDYRWHNSADRLRMKLYSLGVPHECDLETSAGGHSWAYFGHMAEAAVGFVAERLEQERLRVV